MNENCQLAKEAIVRIAANERLCEERNVVVSDTFERIERLNAEAHQALLNGIDGLKDGQQRALLWLVVALFAIIGTLLGYIWMAR